MKFTKMMRARICKPRNRFRGIQWANLLYLVWWAGTTNRVVEPARQAGNRFLGSLKGLQIRAQHGRVCVSADRSWKGGRGVVVLGFTICLFVTVGVLRWSVHTVVLFSLIAIYTWRGLKGPPPSPMLDRPITNQAITGHFAHTPITPDITESSHFSRALTPQWPLINTKGARLRLHCSQRVYNALYAEDQAFSPSYDLAPSTTPLPSVCSAGDTQED
jgi:hypothetical protein